MHAAEQGLYLRTCLYKAEYVVYEQQYVLPLDVSKIFCHSKGRQRNPQTRPGRFIHLAEYQTGLIYYSGLLHLEPEVISFPRPLSYAGEGGKSAVLCGDIPDKLHDEHRLAYTRTAKHTYLPAFGERGQEVHNL